MLPSLVEFCIRNERKKREINYENKEGFTEGSGCTDDAQRDGREATTLDKEEKPEARS